MAGVVKGAPATGGISPQLIAGHSLRADQATMASENGAPDGAIMRQTGHKHRETLDGYIRSPYLLRDNFALFLDPDIPADTPDPSPGSAP